MLPFKTTEQEEAFLGMASERFKIISNEQQIQRMEDNPIWSSMKTALIHLIRATNSRKAYGRKYA